MKTGSGANPADKPGLANFTAAMLDEGTASRTALQIADEVAQLGASLSTASTMDSSQVSAGSLRRNFPALLDLVADVARRPSFPAEEIERQRASRLASLVQQRENPSAVATAAMAAALYGPAHPYGYTELGTEAVEQGDDARRPAGVLDAELRAEQRRAHRLGPDHGGRAAAARREGVRRLAEGHAGRRDAGRVDAGHDAGAAGASSTSRARRRRRCG